MLLLLLGCEVVLTEIRIEGASQVPVEKGTVLEELLSDFGFDEFVSMDLTDAEELRNQGVAPGDIASAVLTDFTMEALDGDGDLAFFESMDLTVAAEGLDTVMIAWADSFPEGQAAVEFRTTGADITDHLVSEAMTLGTEVTAHRPASDTTVRASWAVVVGVTTQGAVSNLDR